MNMNFSLPTKIISGKGCVSANRTLFALGKKALIVTGRSSAKKCGALDDVTAVLDSLGIGYAIFDKIMENPTVAVCYEGGRAAVEADADFVIGIGGGSPLDACKAIAAYAANPELTADDIYSDKVQSALPIIAIPTTAGTGSEVDPVAVMTLDGGKVKKSFKTADTFPKYAFLDADYTRTMSVEYTVSTALDALCHCVESYFSPKSTVLSRIFALEGTKLIKSSLDAIDLLGEIDDLSRLDPYREDLLYGATLGGLAIGTTGTGFNHPLGYNLTLYHGVPHGAACAVFMDHYLSYNFQTADGRELVEKLFTELKVSPESFAQDCIRRAKVDVKLTDEQIDEYVANVKGAKNYTNSPYVINEDEMRGIYKSLFGI